MAVRFFLTDVISSTGDGVTFTPFGNYLYVGANATLGSTFLGGAGVRSTLSHTRIDVAGHIFGHYGIVDVDAFETGAIHIFASGSVSGIDSAISIRGTSGRIDNAGTISGGRGINAENGASGLSVTKETELGFHSGT